MRKLTPHLRFNGNPMSFGLVSAIVAATSVCALGAPPSTSPSPFDGGSPAARMVRPGMAAPAPGMVHPSVPAGLAIDGADPESGAGISDPPLVNGHFINFESAPVKPLALTDDGSILLVANSPNNRLVVIDTTTPVLTVLREIPVGLEPVAVAVQPGTNGQRAWVTNLLSDNVSVVDLANGRVEAVVAVGDEPTNILFDEQGLFAFVVLQQGRLAAIDTTTRAVVSSVTLDCNTPRAAVYRQGQVVVAALHSGNNTTVVGEPEIFQLLEIPDVTFPILWLAQFFSQTAGDFADSSLSPWPDPATNIPEPSPLVQRIVPDAGVQTGNPWQNIVATLSDDTGQPDAVMTAMFVQEVFDVFNVTVTNAFDLFNAAIHDAKDTVDHDLIVVDASDPGGPAGLTVTAVIPNVGTTLTGMGVNPVTGEIFVSNLEPLNLVRHEPALNGHFIDHQVVIVRSLAPPVIEPHDLHADIPNFNDTSAPNADAQAKSLANPVDLVFNADGTRAYVTALGTGRVGALGGSNAAVVGRVDVGRGPRGLALDSATDRLYVMNRTDFSVTVLDVSSDQMQALQTLPLFNPEPAVVRDGRDFLYSTRFTNNFGSSCALCHIDGHMDHIAWDLGDPGGNLQPGPPNVPLLQNAPVKGPMVTLSLRGLDRHAPFHWRGDKPRFQDFNGAFEALMGGHALSDADIDAYNDFAMTIAYPPNPFRNRDNSFKDPNAANGTALYATSCNGCHILQHDGAMLVPGVEGDAGGDFSFIFAQLQLVTQLRGIHKKFDSDRFNGFGLVHDGREEREDNGHVLRTFLKTFFPGIGNDDQLSAELIAFVEAFPTNVMPVVGWQVMATPGVDPQVRADIDLMIQQHQADPSRCDVVAKGLVAGEQRGYYLVQAAPDAVFSSDTDTLHTLDDLLASLVAPDALVFTAVPPGSGQRIGVNQDLDCLSDGLDPEPQVKALGDADLDQDVDMVDFAQMQLCFQGSGTAASEACRCAFDADDDADVDIHDFDQFQQIFTGP